jgi:hypothetical protein
VKTLRILTIITFIAALTPLGAAIEPGTATPSTDATTTEKNISSEQSHDVYIEDFAYRYGNGHIEYQHDGKNTLILYTDPDMTCVVLKALGAIGGMGAGIATTCLAAFPGNLAGPALMALGVYLATNAHQHYAELKAHKVHYITLNADGLTFFDERHQFASFTWADVDHIEVTSEQKVSYHSYPLYAYHPYSCHCHRSDCCQCNVGCDGSYHQYASTTEVQTRVVKHLSFFDKYNTRLFSISDDDHHLPISIDQFHALVKRYHHMATQNAGAQ